MTEQFVSAHLCLIEDTTGDVVDAIVLCSNSCHEAYCSENSLIYGGWNGCHELQGPQWCENCKDSL